VGDFINKTGLHDFSKVTPTYMGGNVVLSDMKGIFPEFVTDGIREGILDFDMKIKGFADSAAVLTAPETRTSSPVRIPRSDFYTAEGFDNVYPCGEGAGYAGGITSAGVDGINCALGIMQRYKI
ncbi:MAG: hypothetical protein KBS59_01770, partial [Clostridiales bacterium]|nr:hypothetical protein [Clostridiales bacterium]